MRAISLKKLPCNMLIINGPILDRNANRHAIPLSVSSMISAALRGVKASVVLTARRREGPGGTPVELAAGTAALHFVSGRAVINRVQDKIVTSLISPLTFFA